MIRRRVAIIGICLVVECSPARPPTAVDLSTAIIGQWTGAPVLGQLGRGVDMLCFRADHTVESRTQTQAGLLSNHGTFLLTGDQVTFMWASGDEAKVVARLEISADGQTMTLITDGARTSFHRTGASC